MSFSVFTENNADTKQNNQKNTACPLSKKQILSHLQSDLNVVCFDTIDSTNNEAKRNAQNLSLSPMLFVANHQNNGRGRLGRSFYSPGDTGLYMSLLLKASPDFSDNVCITTATAVFVTDAIKELCGIDAKIKWVNDIYIGSKKICGILCEAVTDPITSQISCIVIGIGINITTDSFPNELKDIAASLDTDIDRNLLCAKITDNILLGEKSVSDRSFIEKYKARSMVINSEITYTENGETKPALAVDINRNGGLVIRTEEGLKTLSTGEISIRLKND